MIGRLEGRADADQRARGELAEQLERRREKPRDRLEDLLEHLKTSCALQYVALHIGIMDSKVKASSLGNSPYSRVRGGGASKH